jgi:hypothetical protein
MVISVRLCTFEDHDPLGRKFFERSLHGKMNCLPYETLIYLFEIFTLKDKTPSNNDIILDVVIHLPVTNTKSDSQVQLLFEIFYSAANI